MKAIILSLSFLLVVLYGQSQIIAPDTVCVNEPVTFTTPVRGYAYSWNFDRVNLNLPVPTSTVVASGSPLNINGFVSMNEDNGNWYSFTGNHNTSEIIRLSYGTNPNNTPVLTNMGTFGQPAGCQLQGVEVLHDSASGNWFGFFVLGGTCNTLLRLDFGNSLANTPTATPMGPFAGLGWPHQLGIRKFGNEWVGFAANRNNGALTRFDFGTSITSIPTATNIPVTGNTNPCNFALAEQNGNWYMFVTNLLPGHYSRLNFGANIRNNTPVITNMGNPNNVMSIPRGMNIMVSCDSIYMYQINENGTLNKFFFGNDITSTPVVTTVTSFGVTSNDIRPYIYNNELNALLASGGGSSIRNLKFLTFPAGTINVYNDPAISRTFTAPGIYDITLFIDQGAIMGPYSFCKQIVVVSGYRDFLGPDTTICDGTTYTLDATQTGATGYQWSTGATTPSITVTAPGGTYWVQVSGAVCGTDDTIAVSFVPTPVVDLGGDINACEGDVVTLGISGGSSQYSYMWSTGASTPSIPVTASGSYSLQVTDRGCTDADTVDIAIHPVPVVDLGADTSFCLSALPYTLRSSQPAGSHYLWSNGLSTTEMEVTRSGTYWLEVSRYGCTAGDTIVITAIPDPDVYIGPDTIICTQTPARIGTEIASVTYLWNTGETTPYINVAETDNYILSVNLNGCVVSDTIAITAMPPPDIDLGDDGDICPEQTIVLDGSYSNSSYRWNTGETTPSITVTSAGAYHVTVTTEHRCTGSDTITLSYYPEPTVSLGADTIVCEETPLRLSAWALNTDSLLWSDGSYGNMIQIRYGGEYIVTAINKCGTDRDTINVKQIFCDIWLPNAFTPNGDGVNDVFRILGNLGRLEGVTLSVYNRWGERVFTTTDKYKGWDGYHKSVNAQMGTYVYLLQYSLDGHPYTQKGNFHLLR